MSNTIRNFARTLTFTLATLLGTSGVALASEPTSTDETTQTQKATGLEGQININTATVAELELLPGIGPSIAKRIVDYRKDNPFQQRNQIMRVKGVGQKTFAKIKDFLTVEGETTLKLVK